jgi:hypothetical protein
MVHYSTPSSQWLTSYGYRKMAGLLNSGKSGLTWPFGINQDFGKILPWPPQKLCVWKTSLMNTTFHWLLIRPIRHTVWSLRTFEGGLKCWTDSGQIGHWKEIPALRNQNGWNLVRLHYGFVASLLSFSTPTHIHNFDNHSKGYDRLKTANMWSSADCRKSNSSTVSILAKITIYKIAVLLSRLGSLMICIHDLTVLTKTKEVIRYC